MKVAVARFPGSNCDDDVLHVLRDVAGQDAVYAWHKDAALPSGTDAVVVPGGFSYGDYLRAGAMAAHSPIMSDIKRFADAGGPVLGICNGFQILCEAGLLDGALARNASLRFVCRDVDIAFSGRATPWTAGIATGAKLRVPVAHAEGRYVHPDVARLEREGRVVFRYVDNPNGSTNDIAGICNARGNVVGLMPHPERASESILGGTDGKALFASLVSNRGR